MAITSIHLFEGGQGTVKLMHQDREVEIKFTKEETLALIREIEERHLPESLLKLLLRLQLVTEPKP